jgi:serine/threonine-protein kinase HipA
MTQPGDDDLEQLRTLDRADVFKAGRQAATLTRTAGGVQFRYLDGWVAAGGPAVATTLPVTAEPVTRPGGALPASEASAATSAASRSVSASLMFSATGVTVPVMV